MFDILSKIHVTMDSYSCLVGLVVMMFQTSEQERPGFDSLLRQIIFSICQNPLLNLLANFRFIKPFACLERVTTHFSQRRGCHSRHLQLRGWYSSNDAHPECERPGFDPPTEALIFLVRRNPLLHKHMLICSNDTFVTDN